MIYNNSKAKKNPTKSLFFLLRINSETATAAKTATIREKEAHTTNTLHRIYESKSCLCAFVFWANINALRCRRS